MTPGVLFNFGMQVFCLYSGIDTTNTNGNLSLQIPKPINSTNTDLYD